MHHGFISYHDLLFLQEKMWVEGIKNWKVTDEQNLGIGIWVIKTLIKHMGEKYMGCHVHILYAREVVWNENICV